MTDKAPATQACIKRAIEAARKAGLRVTAIRPDGTVLVDDGEVPADPIFANVDLAKWEDAGHG